MKSVGERKDASRQRRGWRVQDETGRDGTGWDGTGRQADGGEASLGFVAGRPSSGNGQWWLGRVAGRQADTQAAPHPCHSTHYEVKAKITRSPASLGLEGTQHML